MEYKFLILFHVFGASIWIGGFLVAALGILPKARKANDPGIITGYLDAFKIPGHIAITIQLLTGLRLAMLYMDAGEHAVTIIGAKLFLIVAIIVMMIAAKKGRLTTPDTTLSKVSGYVYIMALISVAMMVLGLNFKLGLF